MPLDLRDRLSRALRHWLEFTKGGIRSPSPSSRTSCARASRGSRRQSRAVPELTQIANIKLNGRVSLWATHAALRLPRHIQQARLAIMPNMRIIVVTVVALLSPAVAHASKDCMTKAEARKVFRTSYLYWHGKGRCWDAASRHQKVGALRRHRVEAAHKAKLEPEVTVAVVDRRQVPTPAERTLTPDDLRKWGNSMAAMPAEPIVTILDRWPDEELPQRRTKPAAVEEPSLMNTTTIVMMIIMFMVLLALLIEVTVRRRSLSER